MYSLVTLRKLMRSQVRSQLGLLHNKTLSQRMKTKGLLRYLLEYNSWNYHRENCKMS